MLDLDQFLGLYVVSIKVLYYTSDGKVMMVKFLAKHLYLCMGSHLVHMMLQC